MLFSKMLTKLIRNKYQPQQRRCLFVAVIKVYRTQQNICLQKHRLKQKDKYIYDRSPKEKAKHDRTQDRYS
jgi:hypothetical protein